MRTTTNRENTILLNLCNLRMSAEEFERRWAELGCKAVENFAVPVAVGDLVFSAKVLEQASKMAVLGDLLVQRNLRRSVRLVRRENRDLKPTM
jgi:hypothetical protein